MLLALETTMVKQFASETKTVQGRFIWLGLRAQVERAQRSLGRLSGGGGS